MTSSRSSRSGVCLRLLGAGHQRGWGASEYLSVLLGLMVVWWGAEQILALVREHHDEFTWVLMLPF